MFEFRLEPVRRVRQADRDEKLASLAEAVQAHEVLGDQLRQVDAELVQLKSLAQAQVSPGEIDVDALIKRARHEALQEAHKKQILNQLQQVETEIEKRREALIEADRAVKVLDRLHDKQREQHELEQQRIQQRQLDEVAGIQWLNRGAQA